MCKDMRSGADKLAAMSLSYLDEYIPDRHVYLGRDKATGLKVYGPAVTSNSQAVGWGEKVIPLEQAVQPATIRQAKATLPKPRPNSPFKRFKGQTIQKVMT